MKRKIVLSLSAAMCFCLVFMLIGCSSKLEYREPVTAEGLAVHLLSSHQKHNDSFGTEFVSDTHGLKKWQDSLSAELSEKYDKSFFEQNQLLIYHFSASSGSYSYKVTEFECKETTISMTVEQYIPGAVPGEDIAITCDMKYWLAVVELDTKYPAGTTVIVNGNTVPEI